MADVLAYIPDLPLNLPDDDADDRVQNRVESTLRMKLKKCQCYLKLGVAVIEMADENDKSHLISQVRSIVFDPDHAITISFVGELELDTYIVIDRNLSKAPSANEVARRYAEVYKTSKVPACESVSVQFPNIYRIVLDTLDELAKAAESPDFKIGTSFAIVYPRAECSFFEDLPNDTNDEKITSAITRKIGEDTLPSTSLCVQYNKKAGNAIVLASRTLKKWVTAGHLTIDGKNISKKAKLAYRILISPVPDALVDPIYRHPLFVGRIVSHKLIDDKLILELNDLDHYNQCINMGGFGIDGHTMGIKEHATVNDPDTSEIDDVTWYETAMLDIKPDILTIINNHQHPIFRYKWNAEKWATQLKKAEAKKESSKNYDLIRHLLRVTVMLNTIGTLRKKKYVVDGEQVTLKLERMKTIGYNHDSKLLKGKKVLESELKTPYPSTTVKVINEDCLILYEQLVVEGRRPLLLNMANATNPGGGYRKGDGAQEENIFRRSDYHHSLDGEIADKDRSERIFCTGKFELKPLKGFGDFYPMQDFGAIYTSGITVFRGREDIGYPYMKKPLENVCSIAMAAYRNPPLTKENMLDNKSAMNTHRKIENIFAIGYQHKHDCLVLSALGCGAFRNPPKHVALLFKSVIYQYAGYFDRIYFAIIDDHNTGNKINPHGNFAPFKEILDGLVVEPPKSLRTNGVTGPYRIRDKASNGQLTLDDVCISYLPPCQHGNNCRDIKNDDHIKQFAHPPRCSYQDGTAPCKQMDDEVHTFTFMHTKMCRDGGECNSKDPQHLNDYDHPDFCKDQSHCQDSSPTHLLAYRHLPMCKYGIDCNQYLNREQDHMKSFRHCKSICPDDNCCTKFYDKSHIKKTIHSFREPCAFTPYNCPAYTKVAQQDPSNKPTPEDKKHCLEYSHVCLYGRQCTTKDNKHYETTIHIARQLCPDGDKCSKLTKEDHLESFAHLNIRDIRLLCHFPGFECQHRSDSGHLKKFRHGQNHNHLTVAPSSNFNSRINFVENQRQLIRNVSNYTDKASWEKAKISPEILNWIRGLQPVHRCSPLIFESILVHGHVMSRKYMRLLEKPSNVAKAVLQHSRIRLIFLKHNNPAVKDYAFKLIEALVIGEYSKTGADGITTLGPDHEDRITLMKSRLKASLNDQDLSVIYDWTTKIAQASMKLISDPTGLKYHVDEKLGTDNHVFSILGPHLGSYYGDIVVTFKQEIMFHPDTNFSVQAGTRFYSAKIYPDRPWVEDKGTEDKRIEDFHTAKLHCSVPRYEHAAATELVASTGMKKKSMNVTLNDINQRWLHVDSHEVFESHLPQLIPLDYVDHVYIPNNLFQSLSHEAQKSAKGAFKDSLILTPHTIDLTAIQPGKLVPLDATRKDYLTYIINKIEEKIQQRINTPSISRGIVITVPGSNFEEHIILPMTISQSYHMYCLDHPQAAKNLEYTYIYWQAMHGDMMLTIANQKIEPKAGQSNVRCLVCYIAAKPATNREDYHEEYSYLNDGHPFEHDNNVHAAKFRAKSNSFYRGCNTDDFFTFCLKLNHNKGEATLSQAGPNGIYNHEEITCQFNKADLDLSRIDYVHVSGGKQDVPIRNLTINHERVPELHPTFDKEFKKDTSELLRARRASIDHGAYAAYRGNTPVNNNNVNAEPRRQRSASVQPPRANAKASPEEKPGFFRRIKQFFFGSTASDNISNPNPSSSDQKESHTPSNYNRSRERSPRSDRPRARSPLRADHPEAKSPLRADHPVAKSPPLAVSKLPPCRDSIYCLNQNAKDHQQQFSHPCRFNELCRKQADEPHLNHQQHNVPRCSDDRNCSKRIDPIHRVQYRHTGLPDYLFPCNRQDTCYDTTSEHRMKYFHGEELPTIKKNKTLAPAQGGAGSKTHLTPCKYGSGCRSTHDPQHMAKYSHPKS